MNDRTSPENLRLKDLIKGLCVNPTPFKLIKTLGEDAFVSEALQVFKASNQKRKVIGVKTKSNLVLHIGEHEIQSLIKKFQDQT